MDRAATGRRLRLLAGLLLAGQGLLVVARVLDHEAPLALGWAALVAGLALVATALPRARVADVAASRGRALVVALVGLVAIAGVVAYNLALGSDLSGPELAILLYGVALVGAAPFVQRPRVGQAVAYSFPLVLAPLALYAVNAALTRAEGATPLAWYIRYTLVAPMAWALTLGGFDTMLLGDTVRIATPRGPLFLSVGMVCAGLYASVLFLGVFALFAWERRTPPARLAAYLAVGLLGLHAANVARLVLLGAVGYEWGADALQTFHQHAGWVLFLAWSILFWFVVLRKLEGPGRTPSP